MKKIIIFIGLGVALLVFSCNKENDIKINGKTSVQHNVSKEDPVALEYLYKYVEYDPFGDTLYVIPLFCAWPPVNCLPEVIITPDAKQCSIEVINAYNDFIQKFENGEISLFFSKGDYLTLFPKLKDMQDVVEGLCSGEIILHHDISKQNGFDYYIGLPDGVYYLSSWSGKEKCVFQIDNQLN